MTTTIVTRPLAPADVDRAAEVLGLAFADYAWTRWVVDGRDHVARITDLQRLLLQHLRPAAGAPRTCHRLRWP